MRRVVLVAVAGLALAMPACSSGLISADGKVTLDGAPLPEGQISFVPDGSGQGAAATITNGSYSLRVKPGTYRVVINASKMMALPRGEVGMDGAREEVRQYLPARYNSRSELKATLPAPGPVNFDLKSK